MTSDKHSSGTQVSVEKPDSQAAKKPPVPENKDRPGFDLGGAKEKPDSGGKANSK